MKKNNFFKIVGLVSASFLIVFGSIGNFLRTLKLAGKKETKRK
jgi:hypothetical protein